jgi:hypothetical protein
LVAERCFDFVGDLGREVVHLVNRAAPLRCDPDPSLKLLAVERFTSTVALYDVGLRRWPAELEFRIFLDEPASDVGNSGPAASIASVSATLMDELETDLGDLVDLAEPLKDRQPNRSAWNRPVGSEGVDVFEDGVDQLSESISVVLTDSGLRDAAPQGLAGERNHASIGLPYLQASFA